MRLRALSNKYQSIFRPQELIMFDPSSEWKDVDLRTGLGLGLSIRDTWIHQH